MLHNVSLGMSIFSLHSLDVYLLHIFQTAFRQSQTFVISLPKYKIQWTFIYLKSEWNYVDWSINGKKYHFIDFSTCPHCNEPLEDEEHIFLKCTAYAAWRLTLMAHLQRLLLHHADLLDHLETKTNRTKIDAFIII